MRGRLVALLVAGGVAGSALVVQSGDNGSPLATPTPTPTATPGGGGLPPLGVPSCQPGAVNVTTAAAVTSNITAGNDVCVTASVGGVTLSSGSLGSANVEYLGTSGAGAIGHIEMNGVSFMVIRARFTSITIRDTDHLTIEQSRIGGADAANRVSNQLIFMPDTLAGTQDVTIRDNDIGWTFADNTGNTGYGCRCYGTNDRLQIVRNKIHDLAADGIQGIGGVDVLVDRNEIGPVGQTPGSDEHSDNIQITGNDATLEITNNWIHHQGYYDGSAGAGGAGATYIHGGSTDALLYENNLVETSRGRSEVCGLGSGGTSRSNITIRGNTFYDLGQRTDGTFRGFEWDCDTGTGNTYERNIAVDPQGGFDMAGVTGTVTQANNLAGVLALVTLDADRNCTSANCTGSPTIGFRKPSGVHW